MRILFVTSNRVGDAVLSTGLLDHLERTYPDARFTIACGPAAEGVFLRLPRRERTIVMEKRRYSRHWLPLWAATVATRWDLVVDIRASALGWLVPTRRRAILRKRTGRKTQHKIDQLATILGVTPAPLPIVWTDDQDLARSVTLLPPGPPIIALGPTANWTGKIWPPERFAALFEHLASGPLAGARAAVLGGAGAYERELAAPLLARLPGAIDLVGALSLSEAAACLARANLFVGNDSGLMHVAAAAGTPTLGLFGPTPPAEYGPAGPRGAVAVSPTSRMEDLTVSAAFEAACGLIALAEAA